MPPMAFLVAPARLMAPKVMEKGSMEIIQALKDLELYVRKQSGRQTFAAPSKAQPCARDAKVTKPNCVSPNWPQILRNSFHLDSRGSAGKGRCFNPKAYKHCKASLLHRAWSTIMHFVLIAQDVYVQQQPKLWSQ